MEYRDGEWAPGSRMRIIDGELVMERTNSLNEAFINARKK
jgi:hypothetical protein